MNLNKNKAIMVGIFLCAIFVIFMYRTIPRTNTSELTISENNTKKIYTATTTPDGKLYQYVSFSFDGGRSINVWRKTLDFAKKMDQAGIPREAKASSISEEASVRSPTEYARHLKKQG